jgi:hypothetical protein
MPTLNRIRHIFESFTGHDDVLSDGSHITPDDAIHENRTPIAPDRMDGLSDRNYKFVKVVRVFLRSCRGDHANTQ